MANRKSNRSRHGGKRNTRRNGGGLAGRIVAPVNTAVGAANAIVGTGIGTVRKSLHNLVSGVRTMGRQAAQGVNATASSIFKASRKNRKASRKVSRKVSRKASRKASRKNRK
jgi:hypothetical protein